MRTTGRGLVLFGVVLGVVVAVLYWTAAPAPSADPPDQKAAARRMLKVPGSVAASEQVRLFAAVKGYVQKVTVDIGDRVRKDQLLAELAVPEIGRAHV